MMSINPSIDSLTLKSKMLSPQASNTNFKSRPNLYSQRYFFIVFVLSLLTLVPSYTLASTYEVNANEVKPTQNKTNQNNKDISMIGTWCGQWDGIYKTCLTIEATNHGFKAHYQWQEHKNGGFHKKQLKGKQLNINTINFEGKLFAINLQDHNKATAFGIFQQHTRVAQLSRQMKDSPSN